MSINLKKVPSTPGVYKFFNNHQIIYIGKAKDLKKRVSSYFGKSVKDRKTSQIKFLTDKIETFTTKNEVEALLLEQMLIKENKPKFNIEKCFSRWKNWVMRKERQISDKDQINGHEKIIVISDDNQTFSSKNHP